MNDIAVQKSEAPGGKLRYEKILGLLGRVALVISVIQAMRMCYGHAPNFIYDAWTKADVLRAPSDHASAVAMLHVDPATHPLRFARGAAYFVAGILGWYAAGVLAWCYCGVLGELITHGWKGYFKAQVEYFRQHQRDYEVHQARERRREARLKRRAAVQGDNDNWIFALLLGLIIGYVIFGGMR